MKFLTKLLISLLIIGLLASGVFLIFKNLKGNIFGGISDWWNSIFNRKQVEITIHDDLKGTVNGGLTIAEIERFKELAVDKPVYQDIFKDFFVTETQQHVILSRKIDGLKNEYWNMSFVKSNDKLIWDGTWGLVASVPAYSWFKAAHDFDRMTIVYYNDKPISDKTFNHSWGSENLVSFSDFKIETFANYFWADINPLARWVHWEREETKLLEIMRARLSNDVVFKRFQNIHDNLTDVTIETTTGFENIETKLFIRDYLNNMANFIYQNSKTTDKTDKQTVLNMSDYYTSFVPENLQTNFPITETDKANFDDFDFYPIYENETFFNVTYKYQTVNFNRNQKNIDNNKAVKDSITKIETPTRQETEYTELQIDFRNSNNADLRNLDLNLNPVILRFGDKFLTIDTINKLNTTQTLGFKKGSNINYEISSNALIFNAYNGVLALTQNTSKLTIDFEFYNNLLPVTIKLMPIEGLNLDKIDLQKTPVTIGIVNKNDNTTSHVFKFDNNEKLINGIEGLVEGGRYVYTIISDKLQFNVLSAEFDIEMNRREYHFTFYLENENENKFSMSFYETVISDEQGQREVFFRLMDDMNYVYILSDAGVEFICFEIFSVDESSLIRTHYADIEDIKNNWNFNEDYNKKITTFNYDAFKIRVSLQLKTNEIIYFNEIIDTRNINSQDLVIVIDYKN